MEEATLIHTTVLRHVSSRVSLWESNAGNGEIVAVGDADDTPAAAKEGCGAVQRAADGATVLEADN